MILFIFLFLLLKLVNNPKCSEWVLENPSSISHAHLKSIWPITYHVPDVEPSNPSVSVSAANATVSDHCQCLPHHVGGFTYSYSDSLRKSSGTLPGGNVAYLCKSPQSPTLSPQHSFRLPNPMLFVNIYYSPADNSFLRQIFSDSIVLHKLCVLTNPNIRKCSQLIQNIIILLTVPWKLHRISHVLEKWPKSSACFT